MTTNATPSVSFGWTTVKSVMPPPLPMAVLTVDVTSARLTMPLLSWVIAVMATAEPANVTLVTGVSHGVPAAYR